ncbi:MAG TPA: ABC transporter substrate-binding protein [Trebonia sp.]|jgi:NitT/TauT family transport system substrate-binding protein
MKAQYIRRLSLVLTCAALVVSAAACSSGSSSTTTTSTNNASGAPEKPDITLGVLLGADNVTAQIAQDKGFFKQEGLNVTIKIENTTNDSSQGLLSHTMDFTGENYIGMFEQEQNVPGLNLRIVADNTQGTPNTYALMVPKNSKITSLAQLRGMKVGFPAKGVNYGSVATNVLMQPYHLTTGSFTTVTLPFANTPQAVASGTVDAAFSTEPFITIMESHTGARVLADLMSGPMSGFPVSCWATTASFVQKYPKTVAAFQRAIVKATQLAASDTTLVRQELPKFIKTMNPQLAKVITLSTWNTTLSLARMERVADLLERLGDLPKGFDVKSMYYPPPAG